MSSTFKFILRTTTRKTPYESQSQVMSSAGSTDLPLLTGDCGVTQKEGYGHVMG